MNFTVFPVSLGDSFLLKNKKYILVDTGKNPFECRDFIKKKGIQELDLIIITHYDADHFNGLLELINSDIIIKEIWLPDNFGRIHKTLNEKENTLLHFISNRIIEEEIDELPFILRFDLRICKILNTERYVLMNTKLRILDDLDLISKVKDFENDYTYVMESRPFINFFTMNALMINETRDIVEQCYKNGIKIRWLKYLDDYVNQKINPSIDILGLNCIEKHNLSAYYNDWEILYCLTKINRESLVFLYNNDEVPNVLFSADSGFEFLLKGAKIPLKDKSIVTAAHHGSGDPLNIKTYGLVKGRDLAYVRSDNKNKSRPCSEYINLKTKFCTICNKSTGVSIEQNLQFKNGNWIYPAIACSCV